MHVRMSNGRCCCYVLLYNAALYDKVSLSIFIEICEFSKSYSGCSLIKPHLGALNTKKLPIIMHYGYDKMAIGIQKRRRFDPHWVRSGF